MNKSIISFVLIFVIFFSILQSVHSQSESPEKKQEVLEKTILSLDKQFWEAYNLCNVEVFPDFLTEDLEFYHDKGGLSVGLESLIKLMKENCDNTDFRLRREAVSGTITVYPIKNYGAILSGEHVFYANETGKPEKLIEKAKFTHLWRSENNTWKMARVLSYDHKPTSVNASKQEMNIQDTILSTYVGVYQAPETGTVIISKEDGHLVIKAGKMKTILYAASETVFFAKEAPLRFTFVKEAEDKALKIEVRENGNFVEEAVKVK